MRQRLCEAEYLVALSTLPLSQIALNTGFSDQSHFTRLFAKRTGITPHAFRVLYR
jgi:AraC family transcriptional regulator